MGAKLAGELDGALLFTGEDDLVTLCYEGLYKLIVINVSRRKNSERRNEIIYPTVHVQTKTKLCSYEAIMVCKK